MEKLSTTFTQLAVYEPNLVGRHVVKLFLEGIRTGRCIDVLVCCIAGLEIGRIAGESSRGREYTQFRCSAWSPARHVQGR